MRRLIALCGLLLACFCNSMDSSEKPNPGCNFTESQCIRKAASFVAAAHLNWGDITSKEFVDSVYRFYYPTPQDEQALIGPRGVMVNCASGETGFTPRM